MLTNFDIDILFIKVGETRRLGRILRRTMECTDKIWFGKHQDKTIEEIPSDYLEWLFNEFADHHRERYAELATAAETEYTYRENSNTHKEI